MATIIKGYKIDGADLNKIEMVLEAMKDRIETKAKRLYAELLANEIELFVDDIALNILKRPENTSIYDCCVNELKNKIGWATGNNAPTVYNFGVQATVCLYKGDTLIKLFIANERLAKEIKSIPDTVDFSLTDGTDPSNEERAKVWNEVKSLYSDGTNPLVRQLYPVGAIEVSWDKIAKHFHKPSERLELRTRYTLTSELLNMIGMQKEIPNFRLLPYLDEAMGMLDLPAVKEEASRRKMQAVDAIVNITEEMVKTDPCAEAPKTFEEPAET